MTEVLLPAGIVLIASAILGGGLQLFGAPIPIIKSWQRQSGLAGFGVVLVILGLLFSPDIPRVIAALNHGTEWEEQAAKAFKGVGSAELTAPIELPEYQPWPVTLKVSLDKDVKAKSDELKTEITETRVPSESAVLKKAGEPDLEINTYKSIPIFNKLSARLIAPAFTVQPGQEGWREQELTGDAARWDWDITPIEKFSGRSQNIRVEIGFLDKPIALLSTSVKISSPTTEPTTELTTPTRELPKPTSTLTSQLPTPTPQPADTLTPQPTDTPTAQPTDTPTAQPTDTPTPTLKPDPSPTSPNATEEPDPRPTMTPEPPTPTPTSTPDPTFELDPGPPLPTPEPPTPGPTSEPPEPAPTPEPPISPVTAQEIDQISPLQGIPSWVVLIILIPAIIVGIAVLGGVVGGGWLIFIRLIRR